VESASAIPLYWGGKKYGRDAIDDSDREAFSIGREERFSGR